MYRNGGLNRALKIKKINFLFELSWKVIPIRNDRLIRSPILEYSYLISNNLIGMVRFVEISNSSGCLGKISLILIDIAEFVSQYSFNHNDPAKACEFEKCNWIWSKTKQENEMNLDFLPQLICNFKTNIQLCNIVPFLSEKIWNSKRILYGRI